MSENSASSGAGDSMPAPPRDRLIRANFDQPTEFVRAKQDDGTLGVMRGHFAVFNEWTEINSRSEGHFMERIQPGAFKKTLAEGGERIKVLYDHGHDPSIGNKPLGKPAKLEEDARGAYYEVPLFDTSYNRDLLPALESGALGASFRFSVLLDDTDPRPKRSEYNPMGIPERTISEMRVAEFGPVTFPAYDGATAGMRSLTDDWLARQIDPEKMDEILRELAKPKEPTFSVMMPATWSTASNGNYSISVANPVGDRKALVDKIRDELRKPKDGEERADIPALQQLTCAAGALQEFIELDADPDDVANAQRALDIVTALIVEEAQEPADEAQDPADPDMGMYSAEEIGKERHVEPEPSEATTQEGEPEPVKATTRKTFPGQLRPKQRPSYTLNKKEKETWRLS